MERYWTPQYGRIGLRISAPGKAGMVYSNRLVWQPQAKRSAHESLQANSRPGQSRPVEHRHSILRGCQ